MTHTNTFRRLVLTTALTGLAAAPVVASAESQFDAGPAEETITAEGDTAVDVDARSEMDVEGASVESTARVAGDVDADMQDNESGLGVNAGMAADADADMGIGLDEDSIAAIDAVVDSGNAVVVTADNTVVGAIEDVATTAEGDIRYLVDLSEEFDAQRDNVTFQTAAALDADGVLKVGFSDAELTALLDQDMRMGSN